MKPIVKCIDIYGLPPTKWAHPFLHCDMVRTGVQLWAACSSVNWLAFCCMYSGRYVAVTERGVREGSRHTAPRAARREITIQH